MHWRSCKGFPGTLQKLMEWYGCCQIQEPIIWCWASCTIFETKKSCGGTGENSLFTLHRVRKLKHSTQAHKMVVYITHEIIINKINNLYHHLSVPISCLDHTALKWKMRWRLWLHAVCLAVHYFLSGERCVFLFGLSSLTHNPVYIHHWQAVSCMQHRRKQELKKITLK